MHTLYNKVRVAGGGGGVDEGSVCVAGKTA